MSYLIALPIMVPFLTAVLTLFTGRWPRVSRTLGAIGTGALFITSIVLFHAVWTTGILTMQMGNWPAPFGISFVADLLAAIMVVLAGTIGFATGVYSLFSIDEESTRLGYTPMLHILLAGVCGAFLTGDIFNLYVWFEVLLIASFVLLVLGGSRNQTEGAIKYVLINLVSSVMFLTGVGILYGLTGSLNMADLAVKLQDTGETGLILTVAMMFMIAFGIKAAVFPLFFWLPAAYHTPHFGVSAVFAGLLTKVGVYALFRVFTLLFVQDTTYTHTILLVVAGLTMITGVLGAVAQMEFRRVLSFHIISQIGYMVMGLALFTPLAVAGGVFYIAHHIIVKANLFFVGGVAHRLLGTGRLHRMGGLWRSYPLLGILFLVPAMSLAGMPPFSGFWAKVILIKASLDLESYLIAGIALLVGLFTLYSMSKLWLEAFWKRREETLTDSDIDHDELGAVPPESPPGRRILWTMVVPVALLALVTIAIGLAASLLLEVSLQAADQLLEPSGYIEAVMEARA